MAIGDAAKCLDEFRTTWLNLPDAKIGVTISQSMLKRRTMTNFYNALSLYRENNAINASGVKKSKFYVPRIYMRDQRIV